MRARARACELEESICGRLLVVLVVARVGAMAISTTNGWYNMAVMSIVVLVV